MRFLDLEHEYGHLQQLEKLGNPPLTREIMLPNGITTKARGNDLQGTITKSQNRILEYHNRLQEYMHLRARGASPELLQDHARGIADWRKDAYGKGGLSVSQSSEMKWTQENFPDLFELEKQYKDFGGMQNESGYSPNTSYGS
jgi:hypothetical protein